MIKIINKTISSERTEGSAIGAYTQKDEGHKCIISSKTIGERTSNALSSDSLYQLKPPTNVDVIRDIIEKVTKLHDKNVQRQAAEILAAINTSILDNIDVSTTSNRLSQLHLTEMEDKSALIEWNFESFRIGFTVEPNGEETSYYIISEDKADNSFHVETHRLGTHYSKILYGITDYVLRNT